MAANLSPASLTTSPRPTFTPPYTGACVAASLYWRWVLRHFLSSASIRPTSVLNTEEGCWYLRRENAQASPGKGVFVVETAVQLNPYETFYRDELCRSYLQLATVTKDETWMQKAYAEAGNSLGLIPQHFIGFFHLGLIYQTLAEQFNKNTVKEAEFCYKKAIEHDPFQAPFYGNIASLYRDNSNLNTAISALYQATSPDRKNPDT